MSSRSQDFFNAFINSKGLLKVAKILIKYAHRIFKYDILITACADHRRLFCIKGMHLLLS